MIFYFSGTGNSAYVAKNAAIKLNEKCISIPMAIKNKEFIYTLEDHENIGFVYPIHGFIPPKIVTNFIKDLKFTNYDNQYVYSISTCAGDYEAASDVLNSCLNKIKLSLDGSYNILMPGNYTVAENKLPKEEEERRVKEAGKEIQKICESIIDIKKTYKRTSYLNLKSYFKSYIIGGMFFDLSTRTIPFDVNDKCTCCQSCVKGCPVNALKLEDGKILRDNKKCILCMKCINCCPNEAINFSDKTIGKKRYKHPEYKITDI